jgi:hypothetical protein
MRTNEPRLAPKFLNIAVAGLAILSVILIAAVFI